MVLESLKAENLIDQQTVSEMLSWENSGFHVFVGEPIEPSDQEARLFVARYLKKSPVSLRRLALIESGPEPVVRYRSYKENLAEQRDFTPLEFLAQLSCHIPDEWEQTSRFFGLLSSRARGAKRLLAPVASLSQIEPAPAPSRTWPEGGTKRSGGPAACMKRVFEIDPLQCSKSVFALRATP